MSEQINLKIGHKDDESDAVNHREYKDKYTIINKIEKYEKELTLDGFFTISHLYTYFINYQKLEYPTISMTNISQYDFIYKKCFVSLSSYKTFFSEQNQ